MKCIKWVLIGTLISAIASSMFDMKNYNVHDLLTATDGIVYLFRIIVAISFMIVISVLFIRRRKAAEKNDSYKKLIMRRLY